MKNLGKIIWIIALIAIIALIGVVAFGYYKKATFTVQNPVATIEVENFGTIKVELYPDQAPETVSNFIALANNGFYDGTAFHRVVKDFMIQAGSKDGDGTTGAKISDLKEGGEDKDYTIKGEFIANGVNNTVKFEEGTIAMARADYTSYSPSLTEESYNSGCSQFFIMTKTNTNLNGNYAAFGKVTSGWDTLDAISKVELKTEVDEETGEVTQTTTPAETITISSITVDTKGINYGMPETVEPFDYYSWYMSQMYNNSSSN